MSSENITVTGLYEESLDRGSNIDVITHNGGELDSRGNLRLVAIPLDDYYERRCFYIILRDNKVIAKYGSAFEARDRFESEVAK